MKEETFNWGILGLGKIAHKFAHDVLLVEGANLYGVASRSLDKAKGFAEAYQADKFYGSYEELLDDAAIDVVYIATPHVYHCELTLQALEAGKAVLCEKPFGMNSKEVKRMIAKAKEKNLFLMEALWTRFIPATEKVLTLVENGLIGELKSVRADFGFKADFDPKKRLFNKELGGGSLLDVGIYPIFLSLLALGLPKEIVASATLSTTGVDSSCMILFNYDNSQTAILDSSIQIDTPVEGWLHGTEGSLKIHNPFHHAEKISFFKKNEAIESFDLKYVGNGYYYEIEEVVDCLRNGKTESEKMPLSFSLQLIQVLDAVRDKIGLVYE